MTEPIQLFALTRSLTYMCVDGFSSQYKSINKYICNSCKFCKVQIEDDEKYANELSMLFSIEQQQSLPKLIFHSVAE